MGYIKIELIKNNEKEIIERMIYITEMSCKKIIQNIYKPNNIYSSYQKAYTLYAQKEKFKGIFLSKVTPDRCRTYYLKYKSLLVKKSRIETLSAKEKAF